MVSSLEISGLFGMCKLRWAVSCGCCRICSGVICRCAAQRSHLCSYSPAAAAAGAGHAGVCRQQRAAADPPPSPQSAWGTHPQDPSSPPSLLASGQDVSPAHRRCVLYRDKLRTRMHTALLLLLIADTAYIIRGNHSEVVSDAQTSGYSIMPAG